MKNLILIFILCLVSFLSDGQRLLLRKIISGNDYVSESSSGVFNYVVCDSIKLGFEEAVSSGDITSKIEAFNAWGLKAIDAETESEVPANEVRSLIKYEFQQTSFNALSTKEKEIVSSWFVCSESERNQVHSQQEQKANAEKMFSLLYLIEYNQDNIKLFNPERFEFFKDDDRNDLGDIVETRFYSNYDFQADSFSDLRVKINYSVLRDTTFGIPYSKQETISYFIDGVQAFEAFNIISNYSTVYGYETNINSAEFIIDECSIFIIGAIGLSDALDFLEENGKFFRIYIRGNRTPLLNAVSAYTFSADPALNTFIKDTLSGKLDVDYTE